MVKQSSEAGLALRIRVVQGGAVIMGPGRADLLGLIETRGSIAGAGRQMGMSYKRAWALVEAMNATFAGPLVETAKGGAGGGGARLTGLGTAVLNAYRALERLSAEAGAAPLAVLRDVMPESASVSALAVSPYPKSG